MDLYLLKPNFSHYAPLTSKQDDWKITMKALDRDTKQQIRENPKADILESAVDFDFSVVNSCCVVRNFKNVK